MTRRASKCVAAGSGRMERNIWYLQSQQSCDVPLTRPNPDALYGSLRPALQRRRGGEGPTPHSPTWGFRQRLGKHVEGEVRARRQDKCAFTAGGGRTTGEGGEYLQSPGGEAMPPPTPDGRCCVGSPSAQRRRSDEGPPPQLPPLLPPRQRRAPPLSPAASAERPSPPSWSPRSDARHPQEETAPPPRTRVRWLRNFSRL